MIASPKYLISAGASITKLPITPISLYKGAETASKLTNLTVSAIIFDPVPLIAIPPVLLPFVKTCCSVCDSTGNGGRYFSSILPVI